MKKNVKDRAALGKVVSSRSYKAKHRNTLIAIQTQLVMHVVYTGALTPNTYYTHISYIYIAICQRYVITTLQIYISELNQEICWLEVQISQHQNCKGHYNDITLFRGGKPEMSNRSAATSSRKWSRMLGTGKSQCSDRNNGRFLSEWRFNKEKSGSAFLAGVKGGDFTDH